jgi:predicted negative regulator of RcsB-dependent stress response
MTKTGGAARPPISADPDSLIDTFQLYRKQLSIAAIAVAVVVGGAFLWQANTARKNTQAEKAFFDAMSLASQRDPKAPEELSKVATRYRGTPGGVQAALLYAQAKFDEGKFDDGQKVLDAISSPGVFAPGVESLKAAGYEGQGQFDKAAEHYLNAVAKARLEGEKDYLKGEAARALAAAGKKAEAAKLWAELAEKTDSPMSSEGRIRVGELTATPAKP